MAASFFVVDPMSVGKPNLLRFGRFSIYLSQTFAGGREAWVIRQKPGLLWCVRSVVSGKKARSAYIGESLVKLGNRTTARDAWPACSHG